MDSCPAPVRLRTVVVAAIVTLVLSGCSGSGQEPSPSGGTASHQATSSVSAGTGTVSDGPSASGGDGQTSTSSQDSASPASTKQLIGGGTQMFPGRRLVALYGAADTSSLGALGEQGPEGSVQRVKELAQSYQPYSKEKVVPAFELIATAASSDPGDHGDYSTRYSKDQLKSYLEAARKNGVYVILDFQPGRADFRDEVEEYADLLKDPNVGVGLDPEWKLQAGQLPLQQIGSVGSEEINRTLDAVAQLTRENGLPQKAVVLHQFAQDMYSDRQNIDTSHSELALTLHADGHGDPQLKKETWNALQKNLPRGIRMAWKNFYDEDAPTFTSEQTYQMDPKPWIVTYQ